MSRQTTATSVTAVRTSREVSDAKRRRLAGVAGRTAMSADRLEHVASAAHRVDHRLAAGVDLLAQVGDVELDDVCLTTEVVVPDPVEDLCLAQHPSGVAHQVAQQLELGGRQR